MVNPYQTPSAPIQDEGPRSGRPIIFVLAGIGGWLAAAYWAGLALLVGMSAAAGAASIAQIILPVILIGLYIIRGYQLFKGDLAAAKRLLWLHGIGAVMAVLSITKGGSFLVVLYGIKLAIHLFGAVTAFLAQSQAQR